jgi:hypothetical protein
MRAVKTRGENRDYGPPRDWQSDKDGSCGQLSVRREERGRRVYLISTWEPSFEDIERLKAGAVLELSCIDVQPPVLITVVDR